MRSRINRTKRKRAKYQHSKHNPGERATYQFYIRTAMGRFIKPVKSRQEKDLEMAKINRSLGVG